MNSALPSPVDPLLAGVEILNSPLASHGFAFHLRGKGIGSGGPFAWGEFIRDDRRLEVHYRRSLGVVIYHVGNEHASHETYMRELGVWGQHRYPSFAPEALQVFRDLAHDLQLAKDFLCGDCRILKAAAMRQSISDAGRSEDLMVGYVGDTQALERMRELFRERRYAEVVAVFDRLKYPHLLSDAQLRIVQLARERSDG